VVRYLAALEETPGQGAALAAFRFTRKVAQDFGAFWQEEKARGWDAALAGRGLASLARGSAEMLASGLSGVLAGAGGGLEEAVARTALASVIRPTVQAQDRPEPTQLVREFLVTAVYLRLALDLGEPLETSAGGFGRLRDGLSRIKAVIEADATEDAMLPEPPADPGHWQGLAGWTWVTELLAAILARLR
jgi:hypothetical protein